MFVTVQGYVTTNNLMLNSSVNLVVQKYTTLSMIFIFDLNLLKNVLWCSTLGFGAFSVALSRAIY